jgi:Fur family transcriptional regulator, ferric uptake regulator
MTTAEDLLTKKLKAYHYSVTDARLKVFKALEHNEPQTMDQIVKKVKNSVNRASVYRVIDLFEKLAIVQRIQIGWKYKLELSNEFQEHHHHVICMQCGRIKSFREPENLDYLLGKIAERENFILQTHQLELQGICASCQAQA